MAAVATALKTAGILRIAFEYQDLIGIQTLIRFFRDRSLYDWVQLESYDRRFGHLDDLVAARPDGSFEVTQVKFTADPNTSFLTWDWLLESKPNGTSRLQKWSTSLKEVRHLGPVASARLRTNRRPDADFESTLEGSIVKFRRLSPEKRARIERHLGGRATANSFFKSFEFAHSEPRVDDLELQLKGEIVPSDTNSEGWFSLRQEARRWATRKQSPEPDGRIRHEPLAQIITKKRPRPIPQSFEVPATYCLPDREFHDYFVKRISGSGSAISVLWGTPGRGKSTYLSFLVQTLANERLPVVRHHYFLSLDDTTTDRVSFPDIANSLMQQMEYQFPDAIKGLEEQPDRLRDWIAACGEHFLSQDKRFLIIVDGLDHVWRERSNIDQMNHLFNYLLPIPENVVLIVGTQRVPDAQLPTRLLREAGQNDWIEIPAMNQEAVHSWVIAQKEAGLLRVELRFPSEEQRAQQMFALSRAFFEISNGHPLHLVYTSEALIRQGMAITPEIVASSPPCPGGDIRRYYKSLLSRLGVEAKKALHLIAGSDFRWPSEGIHRCAGSTYEIDHLLVPRRSGVIAFHGSILAYAREQHEHDATFHSMLPRILRWLRHDAPEFLRWGWLWLTEAKNGQATNLVSKTTRNWLLGSLAAGWPVEQIVVILSHAERIAFEAGDDPKTIYLRLIKTRALNGPEFQLSNFSQFQECAIKSAQNAEQRANMADQLASLSDEQVLALSRSLSDKENDIGEECVEELRRRVNLWFSLRHRPGNEFLSLSQCFLEATVQHGTIDISKLLHFIEPFRERDAVFQTFVAALTRHGRFEALLSLWQEPECADRSTWTNLLEDAIVRCASLEGISVSERMPCEMKLASPLFASWFALKGLPVPGVLRNCFINSNAIRDQYDYGRILELERLFHSVFFSGLSYWLRPHGEFAEVLPGIELSNSLWVTKCINSLMDAAKIVGETRDLSFEAVFEQTKLLEDVDTGLGNSTPEASQYRSLRFALLDIAVDLHCLAVSEDDSKRVTTDELAAARSSPHWLDELFVAKNLEIESKVLSADAAATFLQDLARLQDRTITVLNTRSQAWIDLARLSLVYGLPCLENVRRAANCIIGYGWRKDTWIFEVLDCITQIHRSKARNVLPWLRLIAPVVDNIEEFTDRDEERHSRSTLIDLAAEVCPEKLPNYYAQHIAQEEWKLAEEVLEAHSKVLDFEDEPGAALVETLVAEEDLTFLESAARDDRPGARRLLARQRRFLGILSRSKREASKLGKREETVALPARDQNSRKRAPTPRRFGPGQFAELVKRLNARLGYEERDRALARWLRHWIAQHQGIAALNSINEYFLREEYTHPAEGILDSAFLASLKLQGKSAAYKWLVRAQIQRHGWNSFWDSAERIIPRLEWAAKYYTDKWPDFIRDSSEPAAPWERKFGFTIGAKYLVRFLLLVGQKDSAVRFTETLVAVTAAELSDQPLRPSTWLS